MLRPHGFDVFHDVHWPGRQRANIDHIAVGPPGIFVVDAKNWSGSVTVRDGMIRQNGYRRDKELAGTKRAAEDVGALLHLPWALHVIPAIALAGAGSGNVDNCQGVTVVAHEQLVDWANGLPPRLTPGDVLGIAGHLRNAMPPAAVPVPRRTRTRTRTYGRSAATPREPSARERKRLAKRAASRRDALTKLIALAVFIVLAPAVLTWWGSHGEDVVRTVIPTPTFSVAGPAPGPRTAPIFTSCKALRAAYPYGVK
ncbi:MAG TPA: nuclease-related domain-containing protein [Actinomycetes bacterium]|nr:nuclease-related domain-containing protein [Actinomycetes bacterium]